MAVVGSAEVLIRPTFTGMQRAISKEMGGFGEAAGKQGGSRLGGALTKWGKRGAIVAGGAIAGVVGASLVKGFGRLTGIENAQAKLRGLGHDADSVKSIMDNALASVKGTAFGLDTAATTAAGAVAAGIKPGEELERVLTSVANSAAAAGVDMDEMGGVYNKVASLGKAQNDSLQQVADKGIPIYQALADQLGVTTEEVFKMASAGEISFSDFESAMTSASGTVADEMGKTTTGALANLWAALGRFGAGLMQDIFPLIGPLFSGLTEWVDRATASVGPLVEAFGGKLTRGIEWARDAVGGLVSQWKDGEGAGGRIRDILGRIRDIAMDVATWIGTNVVDGIKELIRQFRDGEGVGGKFRDFLDSVIGLARDLYGWVSDNIVPAVKNFFDEMRNGEGAGGAFVSALTGAKDAISGLLGYALDFGKWLADNRIVLGGIVGALVGYKLAMLGLAAAKGIATAATTLWTGAQKLLNLALKANPIGLVVAALAALVGAVIVAYNTNEDFRRIVDKVWAGIKSAISATVSWFKDTAWPWMRDAMGWIGDKATWLWDKAISPAFNGVKSVVKSVVSWIKDTAWPWARDAFQNVGDKATWLWEKVVTPAFNGIKSVISGAWDGAKGIFEKFKGGLDSLRDRFRSIKDGIVNIWGTLGGAIARPVNSVIGFLNSFLNGLQSTINKIPGVNLGGTWGSIPTIPVPAPVTAGGGRGGGRGSPVFAADGSWVPGHSPHSRADNIPAWLTAQEFVTRQWAALRMKRNHPGALEYINRHGELPAYARGGTVSGGRSSRGGRIDDIKPQTDEVGLGSLLMSFLKNPLGAVKDIINRLLSGIGDSWPAQVGIGAAGAMASGLVDRVKSMMGFGEMGDFGRGTTTPMPWPRIWNLISNLIPGARMTSNLRPGAITASGYRSYHGLGRAVDFVSPNMGAAWNVLRSLPLSWTELYYSPRGFVRRGQTVPRSQVAASTIANHYDHVHAAMADGGVVKPLLFDQGGYLPRGLSLVSNQTGKPEPLARTDKGGPAGPVFHITNYYPVAEPASRTAQRARDLVSNRGR